ncbi:hypothetical protein TNCV_1268421 [Trichonephila clavipes]|nr:hypothetical protein TNCV_1268421 [Trichonephila clavipes]
MTNAQDDIYIIRLALQNRTTISRTISQGTGTFAARPVSDRTVRQRLQHTQYPIVRCDDVCSTPSIRSYGATTFAARPVSDRTVRRRLQHIQYPILRCDDVCITPSIQSYGATTFAAHPVSDRTVRRRLQRVKCQYGGHYFVFPSLSSVEKDGNSGGPNNKVGYRIGTMSSY